MAKIPAYTKEKQKLNKNEELQRLITNNKLSEDNGLVELTKHNAIIIENLIKNDPSYIDYGFITFDYINLKNEPFNKDNYMKVLRAIDFVNSTNVWRYDSKSNHKRMHDIVAFISDPANDFEGKIAKGDIRLVEKIRQVSGGSIDKNDGLHSFSSKICKYFDEYRNATEQHYENQYYVDDFYVRRMLPYYLGHYGVQEITITSTGEKIKLTQSTTRIAQLSYSDLFDLLETLRKCSNCHLTRNELDHIIWYCYKSYEQ